MQKEYLVTYDQKDNSYTLRKQITGPILITNCDPSTLSPEERARLIDETEEGYLNDVSFDIRPGHVGEDYSTLQDMRGGVLHLRLGQEKLGGFEKTQPIRKNTIA